MEIPAVVDLNLRVLREQVSALYAMTVSSVVADITLALVLSITFYVRLDEPLALLWLALHLAQLVGNAPRVMRYYQDPQAGQRSVYWASIKCNSLAMHSASWGLAPWLLLSKDSLPMTVFMRLFVLGLCSGGIPAVAARKRAILSFCVPMTVSLSAALAWQGDDLYLILAACTVVYLLVTLYFALIQHKLLTDALTVRFEKEALAEQLNEQIAIAKRANNDKTRFIAAASHDLRQPVHALTLFADALQAEITNDRARMLLGNMHRSIESLNQLLGSLLDISELDAHIVKPNLAHFTLASLFTQLDAEYAPQAAAKNLRWRVDAGNFVIHSDPALLETILRNLISNAIRYTHTGSIEMTCAVSGTKVRIEIRDTGIGIPGEQRENIFREFYQLDNPERDRVQGLGLGLAIVERLLQLLGHSLELDSEVGRGTCFTLIVPLGDPTAVAAPAVASYLDQSDVQGMSVVVIDDEAAVRQGMQAILENWGCEIILAGSAEEALEKLQGGQQPHVIVVDYRLREGKTGVQAIERLRHELGSAIPALIITGDTDPTRLREAQASGHTLMHKPLQPGKLRAYLRSVRRQIKAALP